MKANYLDNHRELLRRELILTLISIKNIFEITENPWLNS